MRYLEGELTELSKLHDTKLVAKHLRAMGWMREEARPAPQVDDKVKREVTMKKKHKKHFSRRKVAMGLLVGFWFSAGVFMLMTFEDMDLVAALYVMVQIITTVGYGDLTVASSDPMKLFMSFYVLRAVFMTLWGWGGRYSSRYQQTSVRV